MSRLMFKVSIVIMNNMIDRFFYRRLLSQKKGAPCTTAPKITSGPSHIIQTTAEIFFRNTIISCKNVIIKTADYFPSSMIVKVINALISIRKIFFTIKKPH